jgi:hypothetical protein
VKPEQQGREEIGFSFPTRPKTAAHWQGFREASCTQRTERQTGYLGQVCYYPDPGSFVARVGKVAWLISE